MKRQHLLAGILAFYAAAVLIAVTTLWPKSSFWKKDSHPGVLAIVRIEGTIRGSGGSSSFSSHDAESIALRLHRLSENDQVKGILLRINSPGGTVGAVQEIYTEVQRCRSKGKKVVASMGEVAASGGYYLAAAADRIVADPGTITGSIGVILQFPNLEGLFRKVGVDMQVIKSGPFKDVGNPARSLSPEERRLLQASIDDAYQQFLEAVMKGRKMDEAKARPLCDGRIMTGRQAVGVGLVDELGNYHDAVRIAAKLSGLPEDPRILSQASGSLGSLVRQLGSRLNIALSRLDGSSVSLEYRLQ